MVNHDPFVVISTMGMVWRGIDQNHFIAYYPSRLALSARCYLHNPANSVVLRMYLTVFTLNLDLLYFPVLFFTPRFIPSLH
jgi:hypothetical protein